MARVRSSKSAPIHTANNESGLLHHPPPVANIPSVPEAYIARSKTLNPGTAPKAPELAVVGTVVEELKRFTDYVDVFGKTSPPHANVLQTFEVAAEWSAMRKKVAAWDDYVRAMEALSWTYVRRYAGRMQPAFELAAKNDEGVGSRYPALEAFFATASVIAYKAVSTKKANQALEAAGKMPFKGGVGRRRKRSAANEALDAQLAAGQKPASQPSSISAPATHGAPVSSAAPSTHGAAPTNGTAPAVNVPNVGSA